MKLPRSRGSQFYLLTLLGVFIGLVVVAFGLWRLGIYVIGATFVGPEVAELVQAATVAIVGEVSIARLWHAVPAYPTISEIWLRLLEGYGRQSA